MLAAVWVWGSALAPRAPASERLAFGVFAALGVAWLTMLQGPAGVGLLGRPWALRGIALALTVGLIAWRRPSLRPGRIAWIDVGWATATTALVSYPALLAATPKLWPSHADVIWHQGWIHQLAVGIAAPGGVYAGEPNSYPWLYHSIAAWIMGVMPGDLNPALATLYIAGVAAGWLGMWLLAQELGCSRRTALWAAGLYTAAAGFGWIWQHAPAAMMQQNGVNLAPFHGDLVLFNALMPALGNVPPLIPRELAGCLAPLTLWVALRGLARPEGLLLWVAGAAIGFEFLIGPLAAGFCAVWVLAFAIARRDLRIWRAVVAGAVVAAVWLVPLAVNYHRYGGFVSITYIPSIEPTLSEGLVAMGLLLPLGLAGAAVIWLRPAGIARTQVLLILGIPLVTILGAALLGGGGKLLGTPALLRWSRYLPYLALGLTVPAAVAADRLVSRAGQTARVAGVAVALVLVALAVPSTVLATKAVVNDPFPHPFGCTVNPPPTALVAVPLHEPAADIVSLNLFAQHATPSLFLERSRAKVRFRDWLDLHPTQAERKAMRAALRTHLVAPAGVDWIVWTLKASVPGFHQVGVCHLKNHRLWSILKRD